MRKQASHQKGAHRRLSGVGASQFRRLLCSVVVFLAAGVLTSCEQNPAGLERQGGSTTSDPAVSGFDASQGRKGVGTEQASEAEGRKGVGTEQLLVPRTW